VFGNEWDMSELTRGLCETFLTRTICMKQFACHGAAKVSCRRPGGGFVQPQMKALANEKAAVPCASHVRLGGTGRLDGPWRGDVESRFLGSDQSERSPVETGTAASDTGDEPIAHHVY
jgi:hypothetical protein